MPKDVTLPLFPTETASVEASLTLAVERLLAVAERLEQALKNYPRKSDVERLLYSREEAAEQLSVSVATIDLLISRGLLLSRKMGKKRLIPRAALIAFAQKNQSALWAHRRGLPKKAAEAS